MNAPADGLNNIETLTVQQSKGYAWATFQVPLTCMCYQCQSWVSVKQSTTKKCEAQAELDNFDPIWKAQYRVHPNPKGKEL